MSDINDIPRYSYDLIDMLDDQVPKPTLPKTAKEWAALTEERLNGLAYASGYRSCVELLITLRDQQEDDHVQRTGSRPDDATEGNRGALSHVRSISVGGFDELGLRQVDPLLDNLDNERGVSGGGGVAPPSDPFASFSDDDARSGGEEVSKEVADEEDTS